MTQKFEFSINVLNYKKVQLENEKITVKEYDKQKDLLDDITEAIKILEREGNHD